MTTTHSLVINAGTLPLITMLNAGVAPSESAFGDYYLWSVNSDEPTISFDHKIISAESHNAGYALHASSAPVRFWND